MIAIIQLRFGNACGCLVSSVELINLSCLFSVNLDLEKQTNIELDDLVISKNEWEKMGGGEMGVFVAMLVAKVVGCQIEANFQKAEWRVSLKHCLSARAMSTKYLAFD